MVFQYTFGRGRALRLFEARHAEAFFQLTEAHRVHLHRWLPWVERIRSPDDAGAFIRQYLDRFARGEGLMAGIWVEDMLAGGIVYRRIDFTMGVAEIGYWLGTPYLGQGIATRACAAMVDYAFRELRLRRVEILCVPGNRASRAIPERLGFTKEGSLRQSAVMHGEPVDIVVYGLLAGDWPKTKPTEDRSR